MGHSSINVSLTYLRGLEVPELKEEDMSKENSFGCLLYYLANRLLLNQSIRRLSIFETFNPPLKLGP